MSYKINSGPNTATSKDEVKNISPEIKKMIEDGDLQIGDDVEYIGEDRDWVKQGDKLVIRTIDRDNDEFGCIKKDYKEGIFKAAYLKKVTKT